MTGMATSLPVLLGGKPVRPQGPPPWPVADEAIRAAVERALADGNWGRYTGPHGEALEQRLGEMHGGAGVLLCASGTHAVELALRAVGVGPGSEVVVSAYDYPGNFLTIIALGARPVLAEVAAEDWHASPATLAAAIGPDTRAIIASHLHGGMAAMPEIVEQARARGVAVVEDACQCPGATVAGQPAGTWGDVGVLSFGGSKLLSAGRGGALVTRRPELLQRARMHNLRGNVVGPLSELQAAVLLPQLEQLPGRRRLRTEAVAWLSQQLETIPGLRLLARPRRGDAPDFYKVGWQYDADAFGLSRGLFLQAMRAEGIAIDEGFRAAHVGRSPARFRSAGPLPEASRADVGMVILHHPVLLEGCPAWQEVAEAARRVYDARQMLRQALASNDA